jgi:hypothetical protein
MSAAPARRYGRRAAGRGAGGWAPCVSGHSGLGPTGCGLGGAGDGAVGLSAIVFKVR